MTILSKSGVRPEMSFRCCDCGDLITGQQVIAGEYLTVVAGINLFPQIPAHSAVCRQDFHPGPLSNGPENPARVIQASAPAAVQTMPPVPPPAGQGDGRWLLEFLQACLWQETTR